MKTAIRRISAIVNILLYREFAEEQANEDRNFTSIEVHIFLSEKYSEWIIKQLLVQSIQFFRSYY